MPLPYLHVSLGTSDLREVDRQYRTIRDDGGRVQNLRISVDAALREQCQFVLLRQSFPEGRDEPEPFGIGLASHQTRDPAELRDNNETARLVQVLNRCRDEHDRILVGEFPELSRRERLSQDLGIEGLRVGLGNDRTELGIEIILGAFGLEFLVVTIKITVAVERFGDGATSVGILSCGKAR